MNNAHIAAGTFMRQPAAHLYIVIDNREIIVSRRHMCQPHCNAASSHNHHFLDFILTFAANGAYLVDILAGSGEIQYITLADFIITAWDDCFMTAFDGRNMVIMLCECNVAQFSSYQRGVLPELDPHYYKLTLVQLEPVSDPRPLQCGAYFLCGKHFGIYQVVNTKPGKHFTVFTGQEFVIVDTRHRAPCAEFFGNLTRNQVGILKRRDRYKQVTAVDTGVPQVAQRRRRTVFGHKVIIGVKTRQPLGIAIHQDNILFLP